MPKLMNNQSGRFKITDKDNEDVILLKQLDKIFIGKRDYIVRMPEKGSAVAACMSGGLDSTANLAILMEEYEYEVFPFFINRGQSAYAEERASVDWYDKFFNERYPKLYRSVTEISVATPAKEYKDMLRATKNEMTDDELCKNISYPARNAIIFLTGMEFAYSLKSQGKNTKTVFASHVSSDGSYHCSQTWTRGLNLQMCQVMNDWDWQFISLPIETAFGNYYDKDVYIQFCHKHDIPLKFTRTCVKKGAPCGSCPPCWERRRVFKELGLEDIDNYLSPMPEEMPHSYN